jgi:hypothetical protein
MGDGGKRDPEIRRRSAGSPFFLQIQRITVHPEGAHLRQKDLDDDQDTHSPNLLPNPGAIFRGEGDYLVVTNVWKQQGELEYP